MKSLKKFIIIMSLLLLSVLGCSDDSNPLLLPTTFTIDNFPTEIGTVWQYQRSYHNFVSMITDTIYVRIDGTTQISQDSLFVYMIISETSSPLKDYIDTTYWHIDGDTVTYYKNVFDSLTVTQKLIFPLEVGAIWTTGTAMIDSNEVTGKSVKTILDKSYQNSYQITRHYDAIVELYIDYSFVPNIGLIYHSSFEPFQNSESNVTWNLISYYTPDSFELSDFPLQVGASWNYKVFNNLLYCINCYDTCRVTILDSNFQALSFIKENWLFDYPSQEKVLEMTLRQNQLAIQWYQNQVHFILEFPLTVGKYWTDEALFGSSMQVIGRQTVATSAGTFKDAYLLKGRTTWFEESATFYIWLAKDYGIIKMSYNTFSIGSFEDMTWDLQSYEPDNPIEPFSIDKFPNYDGMTRTYEVFDYSTHNYDTILVQVAESSTVAIWNYTSSNISWQEIVSIEGTVAKFFKPDNMIEPFKSFEFPLEIGKQWTTYPIGNISRINSITPILSISEERFFPCYAIETIYNCGDTCYTRETDWVCPEIGIVQKHTYFIDGTSNNLWRLIEYSNP